MEVRVRQVDKRHDKSWHIFQEDLVGWNTIHRANVCWHDIVHASQLL